MVSLAHVALDGSKHKAMSYGRIVTTEEKLRAETAALQRKARERERTEDDLFGPDIAEERNRRQTRLARIRNARQELQAQARAPARNDRPGAAFTPRRWVTGGSDSLAWDGGGVHCTHHAAG
jgi:hypothetical protein